MALRDKLREIVEEISGVRPLTDETPVELTSLQQIEFVLKLEEEYGIEIHEEPDWKSIEEVAQWLEEQGV